MCKLHRLLLQWFPVNNTKLKLSENHKSKVGTQVRRFKPGRSRRIFKGEKSSARLPSEGK
jgi:hypothetical protein